MKSIRNLGTKRCSEEFGVTTLLVENPTAHSTMASPCAQCPWRMDVPAGTFPAEAFRTSAPTAYDAALSTFACHMAGRENPKTCAGFLLRHAANNLGARLAQSFDRLDLEEINANDIPLFASYREMAIANGVETDDPSLGLVRGNDDEWDPKTRRWTSIRS